MPVRIFYFKYLKIEYFTPLEIFQQKYKQFFSCAYEDSQIIKCLNYFTTLIISNCNMKLPLILNYVSI